MNNRDTLPRVLIAFNPLELATIQAALTHEAERHSLHVIDTTTTHDARRGHRMIATQPKTHGSKSRYRFGDTSKGFHTDRFSVPLLRAIVHRGASTYGEKQ